MLHRGVRSLAQVFQDPPAQSLTPPPTQSPALKQRSTSFPSGVHSQDLSYVWNLPPALMGSLPSIIYGAYRITLASQSSPNNWKCKSRSLLHYVFGGKKKCCLQRQEGMSHTTFYTLKKKKYCDSLIFLEKGMATHSSILALENSVDEEAWWATVHGVRVRHNWATNIFTHF